MVRLLQVAFVLGLALLLSVNASAADKAKKAKAKKGVVGVVKEIEKDSVKVELQVGKKAKGSGSGSGSGSATAEVKGFKTGSETKFVTITRVKGVKGGEAKDAKSEDLKVGQRIRITADGETAQKIDILGEAKKKKVK